MKKSFLYKTAMKIRAFSVFITLLSLFTFVSCDFHNQNVKEYLEHWTNSGQIIGYTFEQDYPRNSSGITCIPSDTSQTVTLELHNPQKYNLQFEYIFDEAAVQEAANSLTSPVTIDISDDRFSATAVFSREFLEKIDKEAIGGKNISGHITIFEPDSARTFDPYTIALSANSVPPKVDAIFQRDTNPATSGTGQYIVCINFPNLSSSTSVHNHDTRKFEVDGTTYYFNPNDTNSSSLKFYTNNEMRDEDESENLTTTAPVFYALDTVNAIPFTADSNCVSVYYITNEDISDNDVYCNLYIIDDSGLSSEKTIKNKSQKLKVPFIKDSDGSTLAGQTYYADVDSGTYDIIISRPSQYTDEESFDDDVTLTYTVENTATSETLYDHLSATNSKTLKLPAGTYTITARASKTDSISSDEASVEGVVINERTLNAPVIKDSDGNELVAGNYSAEEDTGLYEITISRPARCTDDTTSGTGNVTLTYTVVNTVTSETLYDHLTATNSKTINLPVGTYTITASASKTHCHSSEEVSVTGVKVTQPAIFYVAETGDDSGNTGALNSPYRTIQHALDTFSTGITAGDYADDAICEVRVKTDLTPPSDFNWTGNSISFVNVSSSNLSSATIKITGTGTVRTINANASNTDTNKRVVNIAGGTVEIKDIIITGGRSSDDGAGIHNEGTLTLNNVSVIGNTIYTSNKNIHGGGIYNHGTLTMTGGSIYNNTATLMPGNNNYIQGGGLYNDVTATLTNVSVTENITNHGATANQQGAGIYNGASASLTLDGCTVTGNYCSWADSANGGGIYCDTAMTGLTLKGCNTITENLTDTSTSGTVEIPKNIVLPAGKRITIGGNIAESSIGVYAISDPSIETDVVFTSGYSNANTQAPGNVFISDKGYGIKHLTSGTDSGEAAFAVSSGSMYQPTDYNFTFTASGASSGSINAVKNTAKTVTITPAVTRTESGSATPTDLYYNSEDKKLYLESDHTVAAGGTNAVTWTAALYNGGVLTTDQPTVNTTGGVTVTIPAAAIAYEDTYQLKVIATYMGLAHDTEFTVSVNPPYTFSTEPTAIPSGTTGTAGTSATYVYFGDWPQTIKASDVEIDETKTKVQGAFTYYLGSDGNYYAKCLEDAFYAGYTYSDGTTVAESSANSYKYFKVEPIKWRVLTSDYNGSGKKLLLAENALISKVPYYNVTGNRDIDGEMVYPNNYKESAVRAYLNGLSYTNGTSASSAYSGKGFLQTAFTSDAQANIATTTVTNDADSTSDATGSLSKADGTATGYSTNYTCANTDDKVFLLSEKEVTTTEYGFGGYSDTDDTSKRVRSATDFAKANYAYQSSGRSLWWLRSPDYRYSYVARDVYYDGDANNNDHHRVSNNNAGIVPAIVLEN